MRFSNILSSVTALAVSVTAVATYKKPPTAPSTQYLFTANIQSAAPVLLGETPAGGRAFEPISGGNFSGPALSGKVVGGLDFGLTDGDGTFNPDVRYLLQTNDGCKVLVKEQGHAPNVLILFETACDAYDWLNKAVAYGLAAQVAGGISVDVWKVGTYQDAGKAR